MEENLTKLLEAREDKTWYTGKFSTAQAQMDLILIKIGNIEISGRLLAKKWRWSKDRTCNFIKKQGHQQGHQQGHTNPIKSIIYKENKDSNKDTNKDSNKDSIYPSWLDMKLWRDYKKHRIAIRKTMTKRAEVLNIKSLLRIMKTGYSQEKIIHNVIERGWRGIYAPVDNFSKAEAAPIPRNPKRDPAAEALAIEQTKARQQRLNHLAEGIKTL